MIYRVLLSAAVIACAGLMSAHAQAAVDIAKGKKNICQMPGVHSVAAGKHKIGPSLAGVFGRKAGSAPGFKEYRGLKDAAWK